MLTDLYESVNFGRNHELLTVCGLEKSIAHFMKMVVYKNNYVRANGRRRRMRLTEVRDCSPVGATVTMPQIQYLSEYLHRSAF